MASDEVPGVRRLQPDLLFSRAQQHGGPVSGVQVMVEGSMTGRMELGRIIGCRSLLGSVGTEQVVEGKPARAVLGDQVGAGQLGQHLAGRSWRGGGEAGRDRLRDVGSWVHTQETKHGRRRFGELPVGPRVDGPDIAGRIPRVQGIQPPGGSAQLGGQLGEREGWDGWRPGRPR